MESNLSKIIQQYSEGNVGGARRRLVDLLAANPGHEDAWRMVEILFPDPDVQAECYQEILARAPTSRKAADMLQVIKSKSDPSGQAGGRAEGEVFSLVGERPDPSELRTCPNPRCGATIPKAAVKCQWCGELLMKE